MNTLDSWHYIEMHIPIYIIRKVCFYNKKAYHLHKIAFKRIKQENGSIYMYDIKESNRK